MYNTHQGKRILKIFFVLIFLSFVYPSPQLSFTRTPFKTSTTFISFRVNTTNVFTYLNDVEYLQ